MPAVRGPTGRFADYTIVKEVRGVLHPTGKTHFLVWDPSKGPNGALVTMPKSKVSPDAVAEFRAEVKWLRDNTNHNKKAVVPIDLALRNRRIAIEHGVDFGAEVTVVRVIRRHPQRGSHVSWVEGAGYPPLCYRWVEDAKVGGTLFDFPSPYPPPFCASHPPLRFHRGFSQNTMSTPDSRSRRRRTIASVECRSARTWTT